MSQHSFRSFALPLSIIAASTLPAACAFNTTGTADGGGGPGTTSSTTSTTSSTTTIETPCEANKSEACYNGPPGSDGKGPCKAGTHVCKPDGSGYGPCMGEVLPALAESCDTPEDDDCDGLVNEDCACNPNETQPCYTGPGSTKNVGICKEGMQTCGADHTWGPCENQTLPGMEVCATPEDEDCNGHAFDDAVAGCVCEPNKTGPCDTGNMGVCATGTALCDADGKGYGTCTPDATPSFDDCTTMEDEDCDGHAVSSCTGAPVLAKTSSTGLGDDVVFAVATAPDGSFVVGGVTNGIAPDFAVSGGQLLLAKYNTDGTPAWSKTVTMSTYAVARAVAVNPAGEVFALGEFQGKLDFGGGTMLTSNGSGANEDMFLVKLDAAGAVQWLKRYGDNNFRQYGYGVAADAAGNVYLTGSYEGDLNFGSGCNLADNNAGDFDVFVAKLDGAGACQWAVRAGDGAVQAGYGIALTKQNDVVVTGVMAGVMNFGPTMMGSAGKDDAFVAKLKGSDGSEIWAKRFGDGEDQAGISVAVDPSDNIAITGTYTGSIDLGNGALTNPSTSKRDVFVAKLGSNGGALWSKGFGNGEDQTAELVAVDGAGHVVVVGSFTGAINFGGANLTNPDPTNAAYDIYVAKLASSTGTHLASQRFGDGADQRCWGVSIDSKGNAIIGGGFKGSVTFGAAGTFNTASGFDAYAVKLDP